MKAGVGVGVGEFVVKTNEGAGGGCSANAAARLASGVASKPDSELTASHAFYFWST
jgi:hypothetical protein